MIEVGVVRTEVGVGVGVGVGEAARVVSTSCDWIFVASVGGFLRVLNFQMPYASMAPNNMPTTTAASISFRI
jgi:hypothetical protein